MNGDFSSKKRTPEGVIWLLMIWKVLFCENVAGLKRRAQEEAILPSSHKLTKIRPRKKKKKKKKRTRKKKDWLSRTRRMSSKCGLESVDFAHANITFACANRTLACANQGFACANVCSLYNPPVRVSSRSRLQTSRYSAKISRETLFITDFLLLYHKH
jgi:hypothetical protein